MNEDTIDSLYMKRMKEYLVDLDKSVGTTEGLTNTTKIIGGTGLIKTGLGIAGMFLDAPQVEGKYKPSYVQNPGIKAAANNAMADAFSNNDDYAARINIRNNKVAQMLSGIGNSGGDRNFVAANNAIATDIENKTNLALDKQLEDEKTAKIGAASGLQQLALYDQLNASRDNLNASEQNFKVEQYNNELKSRHIKGISDLIAGGLNDFGAAAGNEIKEDAHTNLQKLMIGNVMGKYFTDYGSDDKITNYNFDLEDIKANAENNLRKNPITNIRQIDAYNSKKQSLADLLR